MHLEKHFDVMVGVSTEQNSTNLVPFIQFGGNHLILAETQEALDAKWSEGPSIVVKELRKKNFSTIPIGNGDNLAETGNILSNAVRDLPTVCWNFGGGQKIQQLALFEVFSKRIRDGKNDWACYSDPKSRLSYLIYGSSEGDFTSTQIHTDAFMTLEEILFTFGNRMKEKTGECLWSRQNVSKCLPAEVLSDEQAGWFYDFHKRQKMFRYYDIEKEPPPAGETIYPGKWSRLGDYFEKVVQRQVFDIISKNPDKHTVNEVWVNVNVFSKNKGGQVAEYDVLLVTNFGTIIPLDAKSYDFSTKDEHARLHNLTKVSGRYTTFWSVFPYFQEDLSDTSYLHQDKEWKKLLIRPFEMEFRKSSMLVITEKGISNFRILKRKRNKVVLTPENNEDSIRVVSLESLLDHLNLKRKA